MAVTCGDIPRLICSVIIPPVGVYFQVGCTKDLTINILLTLLCYVPGLLHAIYILCKLNEMSSAQNPRLHAAAPPVKHQESAWWEESNSPYPAHGEPEYVSTQPQHHPGRGHSHEATSGVINWRKVADVICAVLLPPLGVFLQTGCNKDLAINVLLTILGYLPGIIHALYVILTA
ncbi:hypothetical protein P43SY_006932 [Pythium insidiosum]|uniref:Ric1 protein n=1 Tax=Pythium insidiosum TaxID=114742 RepID=A0AAD5M7Z0_PYTIN|nr:hypothetical protein P43SY_006932 [Pythium insidiosum]